MSRSFVDLAKSLFKKKAFGEYQENLRQKFDRLSQEELSKILNGKRGHKAQEDLVKDIIDIIIAIHEESLNRKHEDKTYNKLQLRSSFYKSLNSFDSSRSNEIAQYLGPENYKKFLEIVNKEFEPYKNISHKGKTSIEKLLYGKNYKLSQIIRGAYIAADIASGKTHSDTTTPEEAKEQIKNYASIISKKKIDDYNEAILILDKLEQEMEAKTPKSSKIDDDDFKRGGEDLSYDFRRQKGKFIEQIINYIKYKSDEFDVYTLDNDTARPQTLKYLKNKMDTETIEELQNIIKNYKIDGLNELVNNIYRSERRNDTLSLVKTGFMDYLYCLANRVVQKSKINPAQKAKFNETAQEKMNNLTNNILLPYIVDPLDFVVFEKRMKKKRLTENQKINLAAIRKKTAAIKENTIDMMSKKPDAPSPADFKVGIAKFKIKNKLLEIFNFIETENEDLKEKLSKYKMYIQSHQNRIKNSEKINKLLSVVDLLSKTKTKIKDEKFINGIINDFKWMFGISEDPKNINTRTAKTERTIKTDEESDYLRFSIKVMDLRSRGEQNKVFDPKIFYNEKRGKYETYIDVVSDNYPKSIYEYVKFQPSSAIPKPMEQYYKDKYGETLALYDENKDLIANCSYNGIRFVKKVSRLSEIKNITRKRKKKEQEK